MRIVFAGTPEFARQALAALADAGHDVVLVLTQPDRPSGRGMKLTPSPVKAEAVARHLPVYQPASLKNPATHEPLIDAKPDVMVVAAYGLILPQAVLDIPGHGCLNIHASLLPRWRGAAPIQRAIEAGDRETGICIMQMEAGLDTGPVLLASTVPITHDDTAGTLHDKLARQGALAIVEALSGLESLTPQTQPETGVTYAAKIGKEDARLDWTEAAERLAAKVRAYNPTPGAWTLWNGDPLKIWSATPIEETGKPGVVLQGNADGLVVACGVGALKITELQKAGSKRMAADAFLLGSEKPEVLGC
jgi:methionyl-tRNA formyltransferase